MAYTADQSRVGQIDECVYDVAIIGASYSGLSAALMLANLGLAVLVLEQRPLNLRDADQSPARLLAISRRSCDIYEQGGIPGLFSAAQPINFIRIMEEDVGAILDFDPAELHLPSFGVMIDECDLLQQLYAQAIKHSGISLHYDVNILSIAAAPLVSIKTPTAQWRARLLLAADGKHSWVRQTLGIATERFDYKQYALIADIRHAHPHDGAAIEKFLPTGPFAILPKTGGYSSSIVWTMPNHTAHQLRALPQQELADLLYRHFGDYLGHLTMLGDAKFFPLSLMHAQTYIAPRVALVGDAAHAIHPLAGQGLNLGLRDIEQLVQLVREYQSLGLDIGSYVLLQEYQKRRMPDNNTMIEATHNLNLLFSNNLLPLKWLRGAGLAMMNRLPIVKKVFMRYAAL